MASFQHSKWSDSKQCTLEVRWAICIENLTQFFIPKSGRKYSHTNSYNFADSYFARWSSHSWSLGRLWRNLREVCSTKGLYESFRRTTIFFMVPRTSLKKWRIKSCLHWLPLLANSRDYNSWVWPCFQSF